MNIDIDNLSKYSHWEEHPEHPASDWQYEVANGDTRLGYWDWLSNILDEAHPD